MVSTRNHPRNFPPPALSPSKAPGSKHSSSSSSQGWKHSPSNITLVWLMFSLPLVIWDVGYVFMRPHSMPGGSVHWIWAPYAYYCTVDHVYGWPAYHAKNGFTAAQSALNAMETALYICYLWMVYTQGTPSETKGRGAPDPSLVGWLGRSVSVGGRVGGEAALIGLSAAVMTCSKTMLFFLTEFYSGFAHTGHNDAFHLFVGWIVPNTPWLLLSSYMIYVFTTDILQGLALASHGPVPSDLSGFDTVEDKAD